MKERTMAIVTLGVLWFLAVVAIVLILDPLMEAFG